MVLKGSLLILFLLVTKAVCMFNASKTIWETLNSPEFKTVYQTLSQNKSKFHRVKDLLDDTISNKTLFLPSEKAIQLAVENGAFNMTVQNALYFIIENSYDVNTLSLKRHYLNTSSPKFPVLIVSPDNNNNNSLQVISGTSASNVTNWISCSNGIIYQTDQFLSTPPSTIDTISSLPDLNVLETVIKSRNLSNIMDGAQKTIFAPIDSAWDAINGTHLPFGTLIHDLKYQVIDGVYYQKDLLEKNHTLQTNYVPATLLTEVNENKQGFVLNNRTTLSRIVKADIITSSGSVIHLTDTFLSTKKPKEEGIRTVVGAFSQPSRATLLLPSLWTSFLFVHMNLLFSILSHLFNH
ncbi:hypothetical protein A0J61_05513 [Choanephora cucurbitarum]|uniref:FAS1 domain-containing protein n=1 Tax=Choanephora cucurbitarum TaxID=101091 RepID=A0A1C7NBH1_9FUNG|nr:hypothetical protein A0J61_05513 [Choanephora cucurbitarum]